VRCCLAALGRELGLDEIDEVADAVHETGTLGYPGSQFGALSTMHVSRDSQAGKVPWPVIDNRELLPDSP
jgi:hypothetical protein